MKIREAEKSDFYEINLLSEELGYEKVTQLEAEKRLAVILKSENDKLWVYEDNNRIKGWIHAFIARRAASDSFAEIGGLVVSSDFRRKGIGKALVETSMEWAKSNKIKIRVRCNSKRSDTHVFYRSIGFDQIKSQHVFEIS